MQKQAGFKISDLIGIICILIGAGVLIRTACFVMSADIWFDELFTVELAVKPLGEMLELAAQDVHPPLYYILVKMVYIILNPILSAHISPASSATVVSVASASSAVVAAKITSLIPYLGTAAYLLTFIRKKYGLAASGFAFLLIETMPHMSEYMVEARMYSWCAFCLLAMYIHAVEYVDTYTTKHSIFMLIYGVAAMYLHYYGLIGAGDMDQLGGFKISFKGIRGKRSSAEQDVFHGEIDVHAGTGAHVSDEMYFSGRNDQKITSVQIKQGIVQKHSAISLSHKIQFVIVMKMVLRHLIIRTAGHTVGIDTVNVQIRYTHVFCGSFPFF